jgi:hypothetical protein
MYGCFDELCQTFSSQISIQHGVQCWGANLRNFRYSPSRYHLVTKKGIKKPHLPVDYRKLVKMMNMLVKMTNTFSQYGSHLGVDEAD